MTCLGKLLFCDVFRHTCCFSYCFLYVPYSIVCNNNPGLLDMFGILFLDLILGDCWMNVEVMFEGFLDGFNMFFIQFCFLDFSLVLEGFV